MHDMDDFGSFDDFLSGLPKKITVLPESIMPLGESDTHAGKMLPLVLDKDYRLVVDVAGPKYYGRGPDLVPTTAALLEAAPASGKLICVGINVVNVTANPVSLKLWLTDDAPPNDIYMFGIFGGNVPANGLWQWAGEAVLEAGVGIYGEAGAANALYAHISMRDPVSVFRTP
jgi:hypothetical protein